MLVEPLAAPAGAGGGSVPSPGRPSPYASVLLELIAASCIWMTRTMFPAAMLTAAPVRVPSVMDEEPAAAVAVPGPVAVVHSGERSPRALLAGRRAEGDPAVADTVVDAPPVLAGTGSGVALAMVAVLAMTVFTGVPAFTCTTIVKVWVEKAGTLARVHVMVPVPPTAGVTQAQPGAARDALEVRVGGDRIGQAGAGGGAGSVAAGPSPCR